MPMTRGCQKTTELTFGRTVSRAGRLPRCRRPTTPWATPVCGRNRRRGPATAPLADAAGRAAVGYLYTRHAIAWPAHPVAHSFRSRRHGVTRVGPRLT